MASTTLPAPLGQCPDTMSAEMVVFPTPPLPATATMKVMSALQTIPVPDRLGELVQEMQAPARSTPRPDRPGRTEASASDCLSIVPRSRPLATRSSTPFSNLSSKRGGALLGEAAVHVRDDAPGEDPASFEERLELLGVKGDRERVAIGIEGEQVDVGGEDHGPVGVAAAVDAL